MRGWAKLNGVSAEETLKILLLLRLLKQAVEFAPATYTSDVQFPVYESIAKALAYIGQVDITEDYPTPARGATNSMVQYTSRAKTGSWSDAVRKITPGMAKHMERARQVIAAERSSISELSAAEIEHATKNLPKMLALKFMEAPTMELRMIPEYRKVGLQLMKVHPIVIKLTTGSVQ